MATGRQGFINNHAVYVYQETGATVSAAVGVDAADSKWKVQILASSPPWADFSGISQLVIDPAAAGNITLTPNGIGAVVMNSVSDDALARDLDFNKMRTTGLDITTGDALGQIKFRGYAPTSGYVIAASITSTSSGTIANNRVAGNLVFATHPDSATGLTPTTRMTIGADGGVTIDALAALSDYGVVLHNASGLLSTSDHGTSGHVLTSNGAGAAPTFQPAGGGGGLTWDRKTTTPITMVAANGYVQANAGAGLTTFVMPATAALGTEIQIIGESSGGWSITHAVGTNQFIQYGNMATTVTTGSLSSSNRYDCVTLICRVADTSWSVVSSTGVLNIL